MTKKNIRWFRSEKLAKHVPRRRDRWFYLITDHAWLHDLVGTEAEPWVNAVEEIDLHGNKKPLLELLTSERPIPRAARLVLADMLTRRIKPGPGRARTPIYLLTPQNARLGRAIKRYTELRETGAGHEVAFKRAANDEGIGGRVKDTFANCLKGKVGGYRRADKRLKALLK